MVRSTLRRAVLALAAASLVGCAGGDPGPVCTPIVYEPIIIRFGVYAPGAAFPFANARLRQEYLEYDELGCPAPQSSTYLRFEPLVPTFVRFGYRLDYTSELSDWFYVGNVTLNGGLAPTNDLLVSTDPDPIDTGTTVLNFTFFTPF